MALPPDPHARSPLALLRAYGVGAFSIAPQIFANQWLPPAVLRRLALRRLRELVAHAQRHVPFYARHLAGVDPASLRTEADVARLPFLTKPIVREAGASMLADDAPPKSQLLERRSSGSSGAPLEIYFDPLGELPRRVQELRFLTAHGFRPWHTQLIFDNPHHGVPGKFAPQKLGLWRRELFPSWLPPEDALRQIREQRPDIIHGVLSSLRLLAMLARSTGGLGYRPRFLVSKGELLDATTRALIEEHLDAPLVDYYATEETGIVAWQCPTGEGHHIDEDLVYVEAVRKDGTPCAPGEQGELVLTNLYMRAMPFIRYRVSDLATIGETRCGCGRGLPLLRRIQGRKMELVQTAGGMPIHPMELMTIMEGVPGVRNYRIVQPVLGRLELQVRWAPDVDATTRATASRQLQERVVAIVGAATQVDVVEGQSVSDQLGIKQPIITGIKPAGG